MTFGWAGFALDVPDGWEPVTLNGNRKEGYASLSSAGRRSLQVRWKSLRSPADRERFLKEYFGRLAKDARRAGKPFTSEREVHGSDVLYRYAGAGSGRGFLRNGDDGRAFVVEAFASDGGGLTAPVELAQRTFRSGGAFDTWSILGLHLELPAGLEVEKRELLAGKTRLSWQAKGVRLEAQRWAFAAELLARHDLESWARSILTDTGLHVDADPRGLMLSTRGRWGRPGWRALVQVQSDENQIVLVKSSSFLAQWEPKWEWLMKSSG